MNFDSSVKLAVFPRLAFFSLYFILFCFIKTEYCCSQTNFSPHDLAGLEFWIASDSGVILNGNTVQQWEDKSGNNTQIIQSNPNNQPDFIPNAINDIPALHFGKNGNSGGETFFNFPQIPISSGNFTIICFYKSNPANNPVHFILGGSGQGLSSGGTSFPGIVIFDGSNLLQSSSVFSGYAVTSFTSNNLYRNSLQLATTGTPVGNMSLNAVGARLDFLPGFFYGEIFEIIIYNNLLDDSSRISVENYLYNKYSPPINLGEDTTVCSLPITVKAKKDNFVYYLWQDNSTDDSLVITSAGTYYLTTTDIFGRISSDTITIIQDNTNYTVSLIDDTTLCSGNQLVVNAGPPHYSYLWSNSNTGNNITISTSGNYIVSATDCLGNITQDSIFVTIQPLPQFSFGSDTTVCFNSNFYLNTNINNSTLLNFNWFDSSSDSVHIVNFSGTYWLSVSTNIGCTYSDTINITIDSSIALTSLGPDTSLCDGNTISLVNGNQTGLSYQWSDNSTNNTLTINSTGQYWITATNANNCVVQDTINVTVVGQAPLAGFQNTVTCENNLITFNDTSLALGGATITQWFWNFGDPSATNDTAIVDQPTYSYADTGSFTINLTVTTNVGCKQNLTKNIYIYPKPIVDFTNVIACQNDTAFFNDAINPLGYPITNYHWNFGDVTSGASNTDTNSDPFHIFSQNTTYQVQLIATNTQGCVDTAIKTITVRDEVSADFNYTSACINIPISFTDNSIAPSPNTSNTRAWSFFPGTATGLSATKTFTGAGIYPVRLTVTGFNNCVSSVTKQVEVFLPPDADFTNATSCVLDSFQLTDVSLPINGAINSWQWKYSGNTFSTTQNPKYIFNSSGNSNIFLKVSNDKGCVDSITKAVYANPLPDASFNLNPSTYLFNDSPISFTPNFSSAVSYFWNVSDGNTYSDPSLNLTLTNQGVYNVSLQLTDNLGCRNNSSQSFSVGVRNTDLGIIAARSTIDNDGFVGVEADLYNFGSTPITEFEILYELTGGGIMKETWNADTLPPNAVLLFKFSSKAFLTITERENAISCITIQTVNTKLDDNVSNNENCAALNSNKQLVADPYPNPADGDVTLPIVLTEDQTIIISVYDYLGKLIADNLSYDGVTGLNFIKIPSAAYSSGTYTLKISISDNNYTRKLIKQGSSK